MLSFLHGRHEAIEVVRLSTLIRDGQGLQRAAGLTGRSHNAWPPLAFVRSVRAVWLRKLFDVLSN